MNHTPTLPINPEHATKGAGADTDDTTGFQMAGFSRGLKSPVGLITEIGFPAMVKSPVKWDGPDFDASKNEVAIETLE